METKLRIINNLKDEIDRLLPDSKWNQEFLEKIKLDFTFYTNKIENNSFTYGQTISFLKEAVAPKNTSIKDCLNIQNHYDILDLIFKNHNQIFSSQSILDLHAKLMKDRRQWDNPDDYSPGKYKWDFNYTYRQNNTIHYYMNAEDVPAAIEQLVTDINQQSKNLDVHNINNHPLTLATYFHNRFLGEIHPFADGNGRVCRILLNSILIKNDFAPIFINDTDRNSYFKCFDDSSSKNLGSMLLFFADQLINSLKMKKELIQNSIKS